jgi:two-component system, cell cycle response regulator DivK
MNKIQRDILQGWDVVVVDDEADSLEVATRILRFYGATVHTEMNGKEGLALIQKVKPRFILSDLSMPEMDGWGMLYELKHNIYTASIPIFALTAHAMVGDRERAIMAGFHNYMTKPLTPATFMQDLLVLLVNEPELVNLLPANLS